MPFPVLDACLQLYAGEKMSPDEVAVALRSLFPEYRAERLDGLGGAASRALFTQSIYKWVQSPLSLHVGLARSRSRARAAAAGGAEHRVAGPIARQLTRMDGGIHGLIAGV